MQQILELVHTEGTSEVWRPVSQAANCMQFTGRPRMGDFMIEQDGNIHFLRPEATRVRIKNVTEGKLQIDLEDHEVPNWFLHLVHTKQIQMKGCAMFLNGQELKAGLEVVYDGQAVRVEDPNVEVITHH